MTFSSSVSPAKARIARSTWSRPNLWVLSRCSGNRPEASCSQRQLAGAVAVAARALDRDGLLGELLDRKVGEGRELALDQQRALAPLEHVDAEQHGSDARPRRAVEHEVDTLAAGGVHDPLLNIVLLDVDRLVGAELEGEVEAGSVPRRSGDR